MCLCGRAFLVCLFSFVCVCSCVFIYLGLCLPFLCYVYLFVFMYLYISIFSARMWIHKYTNTYKNQLLQSQNMYIFFVISMFAPYLFHTTVLIVFPQIPLNILSSPCLLCHTLNLPLQCFSIFIFPDLSLVCVVISPFPIAPLRNVR